MNKKNLYPSLLGAALSAVLVAGAAQAAAPAQSPASTPAVQAQQAADADADSATPKSPTLLAAAASDDKDKMVCKRIKATGTRMGAKVCRTAEEWEFVELGAKETMRTIEGTSMPRDANSGALQPTTDGP